MTKSYLDSFLTSGEDTKDYRIENLALSAVAEIRRYMREHEVTQAELAQRLAVSQPEVSKLLRKNRNLTLKTIGAIAYALGAEWADLKLRDIRREISFVDFGDSLPVLSIANLRMRSSSKGADRKGMVNANNDLANAA